MWMVCGLMINFVLMCCFFRVIIYLDLFVRVKILGIDVEVVYNVLIMNVVGVCGL